MVKNFAQRRQSAVFLLVCLCIAALCACTGCSSKKAPPSQPQIDKGAKRKPKSKATQRPYVIKGITYIPIPSASGYRESGIASWYGEPFHGRRTSNGEIYDMYGDTAAHKTLPMDTMLLVKNLDNGRSTVVRVNDRGPFVRERIIDLSFTKAKELGVVGKGTARVEIVALEERDYLSSQGTMVAGGASPPQPTKKPPAKVAQKHTPKPVPDFNKGNFFVQVGAFERIEEARTLAKKFAKRGRDVVIQQYPAAGMNLYRVLVFASHSLNEARQYETKMHQAGFRYTLLLAR